MAELLVTVDGGEGVELFATDDATADQLVREGATRMGRPARGASPPASRQRLSLAEPERRAELAIEANPFLAELCGDDGPAESKPAGADDATLDQLAERVAAIIDGRTKREPDSAKLDELLPADAPRWFRQIFEAA